MSIINFFNDNNSISIENKILFGEVTTPIRLIKDIVDLIPAKCFENPTFRWLDPCCGHGGFSIYVFMKLDEGLKRCFPNDFFRRDYIIRNLLFMADVNKVHCDKMREIFGPTANIYNCNFLSFKLHVDVIFGNPPFNSNGLIKTPTNTSIKKNMEGVTIWPDFIKHSLKSITSRGFIAMITPAIWLKRDHFCHDIIRKKLVKIHTMTNTETNKLFKGHAQTPTAFFLLKKSSLGILHDIYDKHTQSYITIDNMIRSIPVFAPWIVKKMLPYLDLFGHIHVKKTNMPSKKIFFSPTFSNETRFPNIKTCKLNKKQPYLEINYSSDVCRFYGVQKIVLAHKMYGFPFYDISGNYGISNRDNYVIIDYAHDDFVKLFHFLNTKLVKYIYETTRYRMKYLEKYAFEFIPDITHIPEFPAIINDETVFKFFGFTDIEKHRIISFHQNHGKFNI